MASVLVRQKYIAVITNACSYTFCCQRNYRHCLLKIENKRIGTGRRVTKNLPRPNHLQFVKQPRSNHLQFVEHYAVTAVVMTTIYYGSRGVV
jgi:hypothetical protein